MSEDDFSKIEESSEIKPKGVPIRSRRKIWKTNDNYNLKDIKTRSVKINLYALENRVKVAEKEIFFKEVLDSISDVKNLNILRSEIESQISEVNIPEIDKELKIFSENCIKEIEAKIAEIAS